MLHIDRVRISNEAAISILNRHTQNFGMFVDLDRCLEYRADCYLNLKPLTQKMREWTGEHDLNPTQHDRIGKLFKHIFNIPEDKFMYKGQRGFNKNVKAAMLNDPEISEDAKDFIRLAGEASYLAWLASYFKAYINAPLCKVESYEGRRMTLIRPTWNKLTTGRISAKDPSIQNIPRDMLDILTAPAGYNLVYADSCQIEPTIIYSHFVKDPRITKLFKLYNDAYFGLYHYAMFDESKDNEKQEIDKEKRNQLKTLVNATNYGSNLANIEDRVLAQNFSAKVSNHPMKLKWIKDIESHVEAGNEYFTTYFGSKVAPEENERYSRTDYNWKHHMIRAGMNFPVQGTAADLMRESVFEADKIIREQTSGNTFIGAYKHDEGMFYVHDRDKDVIPQLAECLSYQVADWAPIRSDVHLGKKEGRKLEWLN